MAILPFHKKLDLDLFGYYMDLENKFLRPGEKQITRGFFQFHISR